MIGAQVSSYYLNIEGFPRILHAEYEVHEYEKHGTERCEVTIYISKSKEFPDITEAWNVTATGFRFVDTYQVVTHKALWYLC